MNDKFDLFVIYNCVKRPQFCIMNDIVNDSESQYCDRQTVLLSQTASLLMQVVNFNILSVVLRYTL